MIPGYCVVDKLLCLRSLLGWWLPWPKLALETQQQRSSQWFDPYVPWVMTQLCDHSTFPVLQNSPLVFPRSHAVR